MTAPPNPRHLVPMYMRALSAVALAVALGVPAAGCASDAMRQTPSTRYQVERQERAVPEELAEMRETLAEQRAVTLDGMDGMMGGNEVIEPQSSTHWYGPIFDVLDFAASLGGWLY